MTENLQWFHMMMMMMMGVLFFSPGYIVQPDYSLLILIEYPGPDYTEVSPNHAYYYYT